MIGCGGTGKSHLIKAVSKWITNVLFKAGPKTLKVLLLCWTGAAASLIGKAEKTIDYTSRKQGSQLGETT